MTNDHTSMNQAEEFELLALMLAYLTEHGEEWGGLHVVLSDGNWEDEHLNYVVQEAMLWKDGERVMVDGVQAPDVDARNIARGLLRIREGARKLRRDTVERTARGDFTQPEPGVGIPVAWLHDSVEGRFPSGTDPLAAVRETMGVFTERTDGSNAMPWWQSERWWHGSHSGFRKPPLPSRPVTYLLTAMQGLILPPSETGVVPHLESSDPGSVYITRNRADAVLYATWHDRPMLYEVVIDNEPIDDDVLPNDKDSFRINAARIHRIESVSRVEIAAALNRVLEA